VKAIAVFTKSMGPKNSKLAGIDHCVGYAWVIFKK